MKKISKYHSSIDKKLKILVFKTSKLNYKSTHKLYFNIITIIPRQQQIQKHIKATM